MNQRHSNDFLRASMLFFAGVMLASAPPALRGQTSYPMITHVMPTAVQRGCTAEVEVFGQMDFTGAYKVIFEGPGLSAEVLPASGKKPPAGGMKSVKLRVSAGKAASGDVREFRIISAKGVSSVGQIVLVDEPVVIEKEPNNGVSQAQVVALPAAICGKIDKAEDVDSFRFRATKGVPITFEVACARLEDKIHDLQKHADPMLAVLNSRGRELATNDDYLFADPYLVFSPPEDGDYVVQIRDVKYDGDARWTYVLRATDRSRIVEVFPRVGKAGESLTVELFGSATKFQKSAVVALPKEPGSHEVPISASGSVHTATLLASNLVQVREQEPNDNLEQAQSLNVPCGVSGRIDKPRDVDHFVFQGKKGEPVTFEVMARRFGTSWRSPLDSVLDVLDGRGKVLATNDDAVGKDARITFAPPADAVYYLRIRDLHHRGGERFIYYLEATRAVPDFRLKFDPDKLAVGPASSAACFVHLERLNGFTGPVTVTAEGLPAGMNVSPLTILPGMTQGVMVATAVSDARPGAEVLHLVGAATLRRDNGKSARVAHEAVAEEEIYVPGGGRGLFNVNTAVAAITSIPDIASVQVVPQEIVLAPGQEVRLAVKIRRRPGFDQSVTLDVMLRHLGKIFGNPLPPGVSLVENKSKTLLGSGNEGVIVLKAAPDAKPIERVPITILANVSVNFMVKMSYSSPVLWLSVRKKP
jgi:hypothetical protein